jgi:hypothetical protein
MGHEALLNPMGQDVAEAADLGRFLLTDENGLVTPASDMLGPVVQPLDLAGEVGIQIFHEACELVGIVHRQQEVEVPGHENRSVTADLVLALGAAQDTSDDLIQRRARTQEKPGLDRPYGDLHKRAPIGYKAHTSRHALYRNEKRPANVISE